MSTTNSLGEHGGYIDFTAIQKRNQVFDEIKIQKQIAGINTYFFSLGRHCLKFLLLRNQKKIIYMPKYTCSSVKSIAKNCNYNIVYYNLEHNFHPILPDISNGSIVLLNNYFGLTFDSCNEFILKHRGGGFNIVVDNTHSIGINNQFGKTSSFISPRKFLPVTDGGILYAKSCSNEQHYLPKDNDHSWDRVQWLFRCIDQGSKASSYSEYVNFRKSLQNVPYRQMSNTTKTIIKMININEVVRKRNLLYKSLKKCLDISECFESVKLPLLFTPIGFPLKVRDSETTQKVLGEKGIYTVRYWPELNNILIKDEFEYYLLNKIVIVSLQSAPTEMQIEKITQLGET